MSGKYDAMLTGPLRPLSFWPLAAQTEGDNMVASAHGYFRGVDFTGTASMGLPNSAAKFSGSSDQYFFMDQDYDPSAMTMASDQMDAYRPSYAVMASIKPASTNPANAATLMFFPPDSPTAQNSILVQMMTVSNTQMNMPNYVGGTLNNYLYNFNGSGWSQHAATYDAYGDV